MVEACHLEAKMKARKEEEEQGWLKKQKEWVKHIAEYKEELGNTNIDDTPIAMAG